MQSFDFVQFFSPFTLNAVLNHQNDAFESQRKDDLTFSHEVG